MLCSTILDICNMYDRLFHTPLYRYYAYLEYVVHHCTCRALVRFTLSLLLPVPTYLTTTLTL